MKNAAPQDLNTRRQRRSRRRLGAAAAMCAGLLVALVPPAATTAAWTDAEHSSAGFAALVVPAPVIDSCTAESVLVNLSLRPRVILTWHYPSVGYTRAGAQYWSGTSVANLAQVSEGNGLSTTGADPGPYTSTFQGGLLAGLLGGTAHVGISAGHASGWSSKISTARATFPLLVGSGSCVITNAS
ncbi:hypothetical protein KRR55_01755 [Paeniglutamicibacter sp. ABSL32-1]|uniref:hypothetical protein n=1 Tax=Paeniglutamicibacter quisquiliarum TaxID=2849498 RepID=UPI001C2CF9AE|nr:hypothetical protein [Paeniglutamicibacter quisquiliarum]MBV1777833.1 hypothetical protein [Paeniglutamicibacter quisquiliarum]